MNGAVYILYVYEVKKVVTQWNVQGNVEILSPPPPYIFKYQEKKKQKVVVLMCIQAGVECNIVYQFAYIYEK